MLTPVHPAKVLRAYARTFPTRAECAEHLDITPSYLSGLILGRYDVPDWLLRRLGLKRIVVTR